MSNEIIGQLLGGLSFLLALVAFYQKCDIDLKILLCLVMVIHSAHFYFLDSIVPALICLLSLVRTIVSIYTSSFKIALLFIVLTLLVGIGNFESSRDVLVILASVVGVYSLFCLEGVKMRIGLISGACLWLTNNILVGSIGGSLMEAFIIATNVCTIYRLQRISRA